MEHLLREPGILLPGSRIPSCTDPGAPGSLGGLALRSKLIAYLLWFFFGFIGVHRFYCGRIGTGILWLLTGGLAGIGWLVDLFLIPEMVREANAGYWSGQHRAGAFGPLPPPHPMVSEALQGQPAAVGAQSYRVVYCTRCGRPMRVPANPAGLPYACPGCYTVLMIPA